MAKASREAIGGRKLGAMANRRDYSALQIKACHDAGIDAILPKPMASKRRLKVESTRASSSTSLAMMSTNARLARMPSTAACERKAGCRCVAIGAAHAP